MQLVERAGHWHAYGRLRAGGRSILVRRSLGIPVAPGSRPVAEQALDDYVDRLKAQATGRAGRGDPVAVAVHGYLTKPRARPLAPAAIRIAREVALKFAERPLNAIAPEEWRTWVDVRMRGRKASSRERFLGGVVAILGFAKRNHGLAEIPEFARDNRARNPNRRTRRDVAELRPELLRALLDACHISIRAQLAVECSTGARVSSVLYGARVCDLILAPGREQITFHDTKNGDAVTAALMPSTVAILRDYLAWRGRLHDREAPLFLTYRRKPYIDNGRAYGGQNKTGFAAAKRRAIAAILAAAEAEARGLPAPARDEVRARAAADAALLARITQHWFRHLLATRLVPQDARAAMAQMGWRDYRSAMGYTHDVPERRHALVAGLDTLDAGTIEPATPTAHIRQKGSR